MEKTQETIKLLKYGNTLIVSPTTERVLRALSQELTFRTLRTLHGKELIQALNQGRSQVQTEDWECWATDHRDRLITSFGFWERVTERLNLLGYRVVLKDKQPPEDPSIFEPQWDRLKEFDIELRPDQHEFLVSFFANPCGCFDCPPGYGKTFMIGVIAILLPKAKIDVTVKHVPIITQRMYPELAQLIPNVGIIGAGQKRKGDQVTIYSAGSLHHSDGKADILIGDEIHGLASEQVAYKLAKYTKARRYGLSASLNMRMDGKDFRIESIFGRTIHKVSYKQIEGEGGVTPIEIYWTPVIMDYNPCEGLVDVEKKRAAYWTNDYRNDLIAKDARKYADDVQVLVVCETIEHAVHLKSRLPMFKLVHAVDGMSSRDRKHYIKHGLLSEDEPRMTQERLEKLTRRFTSGKLKKAIVTSCWNVGVSFNKLAVICRADGSGSEVASTQIPGRGSRLHDDKEVAIIHDYMDQFDGGCERKAMARKKTYKHHEWKQHFPPKPKKGSLREQLFLEWEE
jgi:superfamily II DNA or RNA helicase